MKRKHIVAIPALIVIAAACSDSTAPARTASTIAPDQTVSASITNHGPWEFQETREEEVFNDCTGEWILFHFRWSVINRETVDPQGDTHMTIVLVDQGSTGVGLTTGMQYQEIQVYKNTARADTGGEIGPGIQNLEFFLRWRAPGQDNDLVLSAQFDLVINALGTVIRYHDTGVVACL